MHSLWIRMNCRVWGLDWQKRSTSKKIPNIRGRRFARELSRNPIEKYSKIFIIFRVSRMNRTLKFFFSEASRRATFLPHEATYILSCITYEYYRVTKRSAYGLRLDSKHLTQSNQFKFFKGALKLYRILRYNS